MIKLLTVVGARPQFIKAAAVSQALNNCSNIQEVLLHTGQHFDYEMSEIFFQELNIPRAKYNLNIGSMLHGAMTGKMLEEIEKILLIEKPDAVLVYGDTNSTLAGSLAAAKLHIPICHIEAGLRSFNRKMPEEINRIMTDHLSHLLFCPTRISIMNLKNEGVTQGVFHVGDVMYDMALKIAPIVQRRSSILEKYSLKEKKYAFATVHRAENTDSSERLNKIICYLIEESARQQLKVILPLHPRLKKLLNKYELNFGSIIVCNPIGYLDTQSLLQNAVLIFTDSGGIQKEAYFHGVPCVTLRNETEWTETIQAGWNRLWRDPLYITPRVPIEEYGGGMSAEQIKEKILQFF
jgi:UDP-GlcNAc3NAcA epimerase